MSEDRENLSGAGQTPQASTHLTALEAASGMAAILRQPWNPLPGLPPPGPFPLETLPEPGQAMTRTVSESIQVSTDMAACMMLGALSCAAVGHAKVQLEDTHAEPCHLFIAIGANSSERKSSCLSAMFAPLVQIH